MPRRQGAAWQNQRHLIARFEIMRAADDLVGARAVVHAADAPVIAAGDRLYVVDINGATVVLAARPQYELLATNRLRERTYASIAVSNGELFLRTYEHLWCISKKN